MAALFIAWICAPVQILIPVLVPLVYGMAYIFGMTPVLTDYAITPGLENTGNAATNGTNLQNALNAAAAANDGRVITGDKTATYAGNFVLPAGLTAPVVLRSSAVLPNRRITNADGSYLVKLMTTNSDPVLACEDGAAYWTLRGLNCTNNVSQWVNRLVMLAPSTDTEDHTVWGGLRPSHITFDRCWLHEGYKDDVGVTMVMAGSVGWIVQNQGTFVTFTKSRIAGASYVNQFNSEGGQAAYGILFPSGAEDIELDDTYLEGYFSAIFMGGATSIPKPSAVATMSSQSVSPAYTSFTMASASHASLTGYQIRFLQTGTPVVSPSVVIPIAVTSYSSPNVTIAEGQWPTRTNDTPPVRLTLGQTYDIECRTVASGPTYGSWTSVKTGWTYQEHTHEATLSSVSGLSVNDLIAVQVDNGLNSPHATDPYSSCQYQVAQITSLVGSVVQFKGAGALTTSSVRVYDTGGNPLNRAAKTGGQVVWDGYRNDRINIQRCTFELNYDSHEEGWAAPGQPVGKGFMETKNCRALTVNGCIFQGWDSAPFLSTRNQTSGASIWKGSNIWCTTEDVTFTNNWAKFAPNTGRDFSYAMAGPQTVDNEWTSKRGGNILIENNLFEMGVTMMLSALMGVDGLTWNHNTWAGGLNPRLASPVQTNRVWNALAAPSTNVSITNSVFPHGLYGFASFITEVYPWSTPSKTISSNLIVDDRDAGAKVSDPAISTTYPGNNVVDSSNIALVFTDPDTGNWRLTAAYDGNGTGGTDQGVDQDALEAALGQVIT